MNDGPRFLQEFNIEDKLKNINTDASDTEKFIYITELVTGLTEGRAFV